MRSWGLEGGNDLPSIYSTKKGPGHNKSCTGWLLTGSPIPPNPEGLGGASSARQAVLIRIGCPARRPPAVGWAPVESGWCCLMACRSDCSPGWAQVHLIQPLLGCLTNPATQASCDSPLPRQAGDLGFSLQGLNSFAPSPLPGTAEQGATYSSAIMFLF